MRLIYLPTFWTIVLDFIAWFIIHLGVVAIMVRILVAFRPESLALQEQEMGERGRCLSESF
jgi:hypothetical protein